MLIGEDLLGDNILGDIIEGTPIFPPLTFGENSCVSIADATEQLSIAKPSDCGSTDYAS